MGAIIAANAVTAVEITVKSVSIEISFAFNKRIVAQKKEVYQREQEVRGMVAVLLIVMLIWSIAKWLMWRISFMAVLLYYAECGQELPDTRAIKQYQEKVVEKYLNIKK